MSVDDRMSNSNKIESEMRSKKRLISLIETIDRIDGSGSGGGDNDINVNLRFLLSPDSFVCDDNNRVKGKCSV